MSDRREVSEAGLVVLKVGTAVLTGGGERLDRALMHDLAAHVALMMTRGTRVILVSSGAVGAGLGALGLSARPSDVTELQAAASAGQPLLMNLWHEAFGVRGVGVGQILVGRGDFDSRERFLNIRNCLSCLHERGLVPVVNENDSVATEEISLGDNDVLAARLAVAVRADLLAILTTVEGVEDGEGNVVGEVEDAGSLVSMVRAEKSAAGRGGMATKIEAARIATSAGTAALIAPGRPSEAMVGALGGRAIGTLVRAGDARHAGKRLWIATSATPSGRVEVDDGAARAIGERGASLLAKGVTGVVGRFGVGDVVGVFDGRGREIARGLTNLTSEELRVVMGRASSEFEGLLGRRAHEEVVHRDNLAVVER